MQQRAERKILGNDIHRSEVEPEQLKIAYVLQDPRDHVCLLEVDFPVDFVGIALVDEHQRSEEYAQMWDCR